jgi:ADP-dependent NAD(P)H-hydrate dehydratase / NAD(P)H-hydrate epimerase
VARKLQQATTRIERKHLVRQGGNKQESVTTESITEEWAASVLPRRSQNTHKWDVGGIVVVAGSPAFAGAAALCCAAAGRAGAGIISAALPRSITHIVVGIVPEVTVVMLPEGESSAVARHAADAIRERLQRSRAMVIGPGLGDDEATDALLSALFGWGRARGGIGFGSGASAATDSRIEVLGEHGSPIVVDADALTWLSGQGHWWERVPRGRFVMTPHAGEMARLLGKDVDTVTTNPVEVAREAASQWGQTVVLKSGTTVIATEDGRVIAAEPSTALATAGSGDILSGVIGAFLAQGLSPADAATLAVYAGNRAAERLANRLGTLGVIAGDLPLAIAEELRELENLGA